MDCGDLVVSIRKVGSGRNPFLSAMTGLIAGVNNAGQGLLAAKNANDAQSLEREKMKAAAAALDKELEAKRKIAEENNINSLILGGMQHTTGNPMQLSTLFGRPLPQLPAGFGSDIRTSTSVSADYNKGRLDNEGRKITSEENTNKARLDFDREKEGNRVSETATSNEYREMELEQSRTTLYNKVMNDLVAQGVEIPMASVIARSTVYGGGGFTTPMGLRTRAMADIAATDAGTLKTQAETADISLARDTKNRAVDAEFYRADKSSETALNTAAIRSRTDLARERVRSETDMAIEGMRTDIARQGIISRERMSAIKTNTRRATGSGDLIPLEKMKNELLAAASKMKPENIYNDRDEVIVTKFSPGHRQIQDRIVEIDRAITKVRDSKIKYTIPGVPGAVTVMMVAARLRKSDPKLSQEEAKRRAREMLEEDGTLVEDE